jgi:hypothetical protein
MLTSKLILFNGMIVSKEKVVQPLTWWKEHSMMFLHVSFLAMQIFGILGSYIEIERIFSIATCS